MADRVVFDEAALRQLFESPDGPTGKDLVKRALRVQRRAKQIAPVDTGRLRSSVEREVGRDSRGLVARIGTDVEYAARIEFGFVGPDSLGRVYAQAAQPFLRPALSAAASASTVATITEGEP